MQSRHVVFSLFISALSGPAEVCTEIECGLSLHSEDDVEALKVNLLQTSLQLGRSAQLWEKESLVSANSSIAENEVSRALEEAALAEAALAVAAEAAAAKAAGGGAQGRLLASTRLSDTKSFDELHKELPQAPTGTVNSSGQVQWKNPFAGNPFNPFSNWLNPYALNPYASNPYGPGGGGRWFNSSLSVVVLASLGVVTCVASAVLCCGVLDEDVDSDSADSDDDGDHVMDRLSKKRTKDQIVKELMGKPSKNNRFCGICWCCSRNVLFFFMLALLFTFFGGCLLWKTGILQPLLAQLILIAYIFCLVMSFVAVLLWEATAAYREATAFIFGRLHAVEDVIPWFGRRADRKAKSKPTER